MCELTFGCATYVFRPYEKNVSLNWHSICLFSNFFLYAFALCLSIHIDRTCVLRSTPAHTISCMTLKPYPLLLRKCPAVRAAGTSFRCTFCGGKLIFIAFSYQITIAWGSIYSAYEPRRLIKIFECVSGLESTTTA